MTRIAVLTPDPADPSFAGQWPVVLERLSAVLGRGGWSIMPTPWTDHVDTADGLVDSALVLAVVAWGYHRDHARWMRATRTWADAGVRIANPASVLGWNSDKTYLARLAERGVPIAPTIWSDAVDAATLDRAFDRFGTDRVVAKPVVSGGAWRTVLVSRGEVPEDLPEGAAMIQPYLPAIREEGELSLLFFGGRFSHAVNKRPVGDDFRIQQQFGGQYRQVTPPGDALALATRALAAIDERLLYARIDMVRGPDGGWLLMEAELIEPDFYLGTVPDAGANLVRAIGDWLSDAGRKVVAASPLL